MHTPCRKSMQKSVANAAETHVAKPPGPTQKNVANPANWMTASHFGLPNPGGPERRKAQKNAEQPNKAIENCIFSIRILRRKQVPQALPDLRLRVADCGQDIDEGARDAWEEAQRTFFDPASRARL